MIDIKEELDKALLVNHKRKCIIDALNQQFGSSLVSSTKLEVEVCPSNLDKIYDILNPEFFDNKLQRTQIFELGLKSTSQLLQLMHQLGKNPMLSRAIGIYIPYMRFFTPEDPNEEPTCYLFKEQLFMNGDYSPTTLAAFASNVCHEMIHRYDMLCGDINEEYYKQSLDKSYTFNEHHTSTFKQLMSEAREIGLDVTEVGIAKNFKELSQRATKFMSDLEESLNDVEQPTIIKMKLKPTAKRAKPGMSKLICAAIV